MSAATTPAFDELPLRARKAARTKLALFEAAVHRLVDTPFVTLRVADLCRDVGVTEPTFFNYYEKKSDLLVYAIMLWGIETHWHLRRLESKGSARDGVAFVFDSIARQARNHRRLTAEILARQVLRETPPKFIEVPLGERWLRFPNKPGIEDCPAEGVVGLFTTLIERARRDRELPKNTDTEALLVSLISVLWGVPILTLWRNPRKLGALYAPQLAMIWRAYRWS